MKAKEDWSKKVKAKRKKLERALGCSPVEIRLRVVAWQCEECGYLCDYYFEKCPGCLKRTPKRRLRGNITIRMEEIEEEW